MDEVSCFLLSGQAWAVVRVQHADRQVIVEAAPRGRQPTWGGFLPQFLSHALCQRILAVLTGTEDYPYLSQPARDALALKRDEVGEILEPCIGGVEVDDGGFWEDTKLRQDISRNLPGYRLSKFQPLMPPWVERETLERYLLDLEGTRNWLARTAAS